MKVHVDGYDEDYDFPKEILESVGILSVGRLGNHYLCGQEADDLLIVGLGAIAPVNRTRVPPFDRCRLLCVLRGIANDRFIPPIHVETRRNAYRYKFELRDGFHRFWASAAYGFTHIPALVVPNLDS